MAKPFDFSDLIVGFSINQLSQLFNLDRRTVGERLRNVPASGYRAQHPVYKITDAAPLLIDGYMTTGEVDERSRLMNAAREKDLWDSKLKQQKFKEINGDLWRTDLVMRIFVEVFKKFRESVVVFSDAMEHESGLSPEQIDKTKVFCDRVLTDVRDGLNVMEDLWDDEPGFEQPILCESDDDLGLGDDSDLGLNDLGLGDDSDLGLDDAISLGL